MDVYGPTCLTCPMLHSHTGAENKRIKGAVFHPGDTGCIFSKRARVFKGGTPYRPPTWCPRKNNITVRVYTYKNPIVASLDTVLSKVKGMKQGSPQTRFAPDYAMRRESKDFHITARQFQKYAKTVPLQTLLPFTVLADEIVEIDDGIKAYSFLIRADRSITPVHFDGARARENTLF